MQTTIQNENSNEMIETQIRKKKKTEDLNQDLQLVWNLDKLSFSDQPHKKEGMPTDEKKEKLKGWNDQEYNSEEESKKNNYQSQISFRFQSNREIAKKVEDSCGGFEESEDYRVIEQEQMEEIRNESSGITPKVPSPQF